MYRELIYISNTTYENKKANLINVIYMSDALSMWFRTTLLIFSNKNLTNTEIVNDFIIKNKFSLKVVRGKYSIFKLLILTCKYRNQIIYTRSLYVASFAKVFNSMVLYEAHYFYPSIFHKLLLRFMFLNKRLSVVCITNALSRKFKDYFNINPLLLPSAGFLHLSNDYISYKRQMILKGDNTFMKVAYCGSISPGKGIEVFLRLAKSLPNVQFLLITKGRPDVDLVLAKNIEFYSDLNHSQVLEKLKLASVFLLPNSEKVVLDGNIDIGPYTSPLKLFDYLSCFGLILSSNALVLREILNDEIAIFNDSFEHWERNLVRILNSRLEIVKFADTSYNYFKEKYTWEARSKHVYEIFSRQLQ